jgi:uncharacterized protein
MKLTAMFLFVGLCVVVFTVLNAPGAQGGRGGGQNTTPVATDVEKVQAALPDSAPAKPAKARKVLAYGKASGFVHSSIPIGCKMVELLGTKTGAYETVISYDPAIMTPEKLAEFDAIVLVSTTSNFIDDSTDQEATAKRRQAFLDFINNGKGVVGIHAACDAYYNWLEYGQILGGYFSGHTTQREKVAIVNEDPTNPINAVFDGKGFDYADEIYRFLANVNGGRGGAKQVYSRDRLRILLSVDPTKNNNAPAGTDMPISWVHQVGKGREFYCSLGHNEFVYYDSNIQKHYLAGIQYALGDLKADDSIPVKK